MSSLNAHGQIKPVLRTALVGIQPADQVMLKGYLRVLLRLEADLEWVPANHATVDLFLINEQFREAESVVKLLKQRSSKSVLYVNREPDGNGSLQGDTITLPLKRLHMLNNWLLNSVGVLKSDAKRRQTLEAADLNMMDPVADTNVSSDSQGLSRGVSVAKTVEASFQFEAQQKYLTSQATAHKKKLMKSQPSQAIVNRSKVKANEQAIILEFIKQVEQRSTAYYELWIKDSLVGTLHSKRQCLWLNGIHKAQKFRPDSTWRLKLASTKPSKALPDLDLMQWLWEQAWAAPQPISPIISATQKFQLRYWIKPSRDGSRRELLRLFTVLAARPRTINDIATLAETSTDTAQKVVAALLFAGGLQPDVYDKLDAYIYSNTKNLVADKVKNKPQPKTVKPSLSIEDVLARRKSGEPSAAITSSYDIEELSQSSETQPVIPASTKKRGFLSKLRDKLGL